jgi:hypothetical protein
MASPARYPLRLANGEYFSEALGSGNALAHEYEALIANSLDALATFSEDAVISLDTLSECGQVMQEHDRAFATSRINQPHDALHRRLGPNAKHPYAMITVCRTAFPIRIRDQIVYFYFEKFFVSYSYLDAAGCRRSTVTPVHSHPINFETGYFTVFGTKSRVVEQEFTLTTGSGAPLIRSDGSLSTEGILALSASGLPELRAIPATKTVMSPAASAFALPTFASDRALLAALDGVVQLDGLFRTHQVTVVDDPGVGSHYFALDNYFGPFGRVLILCPGLPN